jgi:hypothetical protein
MRTPIPVKQRLRYLCIIDYCNVTTLFYESSCMFLAELVQVGSYFNFETRARHLRVVPTHRYPLPRRCPCPRSLAPRFNVSNQPILSFSHSPPSSYHELAQLKRMPICHRRTTGISRSGQDGDVDIEQ